MAKFDAKTFNPEAFGKYVDLVPKTKRNELIKSRALTRNSQIAQAFSNQTGTAYATIPMFGRIGGDPLNYDGVTDITSESTETFEQSVIVVGRAKAWTERDFSSDITGGVDFMGNVARQVSQYWEEVDQDTLLAVLKGIFAMTGTANKEFVDTHTYDITGETEDLAKVGPTSLNNAIQKASGDNKNAFSLVIMHSQVATNLENLNVLDYLKYTDSMGIERKLTMATWNGRLVLVDDSMPVEVVPGDETAGTAEQTAYTSYVLGEGAISFEDIGAETPFEMSRDPKTNGGQDTLYSRQRKVFAPYGISFTKKSVASLSPTNAELENGANWTVVNNGEAGAKLKTIDLKAIPIVQIKSLG